VSSWTLKEREKERKRERERERERERAGKSADFGIGSFIGFVAVRAGAGQTHFVGGLCVGKIILKSWKLVVYSASARRR
jgi:hypothetical protein